MSDSTSTMNDGDSDQDVKTNIAVDLGTATFNLRPAVWHSWLQYVYSTRIYQGVYTHLAVYEDRTCDCGRSSASYPHWPPTTIQEAFDQLCLLQQGLHQCLCHCKHHIDECPVHRT